MDGESGSVMGTTGNINLSHGEATEDLTGQIHQLPCCIKHNGPCPVSHFFKPKQTGTEIEGLRVEEASFRGRKLLGATVPLPEGYTGFLLGKKRRGKRKVCDDWETNAKFKSITYWNHDTPPSQDDAHLRSFHWFPVAQALHKPVTAQDLVSASSVAL